MPVSDESSQWVEKRFAQSIVPEYHLTIAPDDWTALHDEFLHPALAAGFGVARYVDEAAGLLDRTWMSQVALRPRVAFSGKVPTDQQHRELHHGAHQKCFIANSIKSEVTVEPSIDHR
jgi:hypothetical protein